MLQRIEHLIKKRCKRIANNSQQINDLIATQYDSVQHTTPFTPSIKNQLRQLVTSFDYLRPIATKELTDEGKILVDH